MARVTIKPEGDASETPSAKIIAAGRKSFDVVDDLGRVITLKAPDIMAQFDLIEALGDCSNRTIMMHLPLIYIAAIDGEPVAAPGTKGEARALIRRLDNAGIAAATAGIEKHFLENEGAKLKKSGE